MECSKFEIQQGTYGNIKSREYKFKDGLSGSVDDGFGTCPDPYRYCPRINSHDKLKQKVYRQRSR